MSTSVQDNARDYRVLVLAPTGRDASVTCRTLENLGLHAAECETMDELCQKLEEGAGVALIAKEALAPAALQQLDEAIAKQPPWSDLPLVILTTGRQPDKFRKQILESLDAIGNATLLERPLRSQILVSATKVALRARRRQYELRQHLDELREAEQTQKLLLAELSHRVKNTLAVVQSLAAQTLRESASPEAFRDAFNGRLSALSNAHSLLAKTNWRATALRAVAETAVKPSRGLSQENIEIDGPDLIVPPKTALTLSMVLHELMTNATKHGALSRASGKVAIRWKILADKGSELRLSWRESGGPDVIPPAKRGFGVKLIETSVRYELNGHARIDYLKHGVTCELVFPMSNGNKGVPHGRWN